MIVDHYRKAGLRVRDVFFYDGSPLDRGGADIERLIQSTSPIRDGSPFYSPVLELDAPLDAIFAEFGKTLRYEIRRALTKDALTVDRQWAPDDAMIARFARVSAAFAERKKKPGGNLEKLRRLRKHVVLSSAKGAGCEVWHVYLADERRLRLTYSMSEHDESADALQLCGRANKALHWLDIEDASTHGIAVYDFGGVNLEDPALKGIDEFKLRFRTRVDTFYNQVRAVSLAGRFALRASLLLGRPLV